MTGVQTCALPISEDVAALGVIYGSIKRGEVTLVEEFPAPEDEKPKASKLDLLEGMTTGTNGAALKANKASLKTETATKDDGWPGPSNAEDAA